MTTSVFKYAVDELDNHYFTLDLDGNPYHVQAPTVNAVQKDICSFFDISLPVLQHRKTSFSNDLTNRDDVLLAFGALLLLLLIEGIVTTFLLRTKNGIVSNFGFSVKMVVELIREFNVKGIVKGRTENDEWGHKKVNVKLLVVAVSILVFVFLLEVAVLFLTQPELKDVTNKKVTFRIQQPVTPPWNGVRFHSRASINRPCSAVGLVDVDQGNTRINCCVTSTVRNDELDLFEKVSGQVEAEIVSYMHEYGAEHSITLDGVKANYSTRAYFTLEDEKSRLMGHQTKSKYERDQISIVHRQYIAYLASAYVKATKDNETITLDTLNNDVKFLFAEETGPVVDVIRIRGVNHQVNSTRYTTKVTGVLPRGPAALRLGQHHFRGSSAVIVTDANETDLFIEEGLTSARSVVWRESTRTLNWLTLLIILCCALLFLILLRFKLKPVAIAEIAGVLVKEKVDADMYRSPVQMELDERPYFRVFDGDGEWRAIAEVNGEMNREGWSGSLSSI